MPERYENYHKPGKEFLFRFFFSDGSPVMGVNPETLETKPLVDKATLDEKRRFERLGYKLELVQGDGNPKTDKSKKGGEPTEYTKWINDH
jgi:hypothetical protein